MPRDRDNNASSASSSRSSGRNRRGGRYLGPDTGEQQTDNNGAYDQYMENMSWLVEQYTKWAEGNMPGQSERFTQAKKDIWASANRQEEIIAQRLASAGLDSASGANLYSDLVEGTQRSLGQVQTQAQMLNNEWKQNAMAGLLGIGRTGLQAQGMDMQSEQFYADLDFRNKQLAEMRRQFDESNDANFWDVFTEIGGGAAKLLGTYFLGGGSTDIFSNLFGLGSSGNNKGSFFQQFGE